MSYETTTETLINIFSQYGEIEEGFVAYDKAANKSRGFAFMTYKTVEAARKALADPNKTIEGRNVIIKLAMEGQKEKPQQSQVATTHVGGDFAPQIQQRYIGNPNIGAYTRMTIQPNAGQSVGLAGYPANLASAYASSTSYAGLAGNHQYVGGGGGGAYSSSSHPHYGGGGMGGGLGSQSAQPGLHSGSSLTGMLPGYYGSDP